MMLTALRSPCTTPRECMYWSPLTMFLSFTRSSQQKTRGVICRSTYERNLISIRMGSQELGHSSFRHPLADNAQVHRVGNAEESYYIAMSKRFPHDSLLVERLNAIVEQRQRLVKSTIHTFCTFVLSSMCTLSDFSATRRLPMRPEYISEKADFEIG